MRHPQNQGEKQSLSPYNRYGIIVALLLQSNVREYG